MKVDFEKAYNTVSWRYLKDMTRRMGFSNTWIKWMSVSVFNNSMSVKEVPQWWPEVVVLWWWTGGLGGLAVGSFLFWCLSDRMHFVSSSVRVLLVRGGGALVLALHEF
jgi:hypothetical protein